KPRNIHRFSVLSILALTLSAAVGTALAAEQPDARYRSPRATVRTLYMAVEMAREDPRYIADAAGCLDLGTMPKAAPDAGLLATKLEWILRAKEVLTSVLPRETEAETFEIPDTNGFRLALKRMPDGRYLFDQETVKGISKAWSEVQKTLADKNRDAAS